MNLEHSPTISEKSVEITGDEQILIADDNPANLDLLTQSLEPHGYRILAAPNGEIALAIAKEAKPNLVLLDVMMPGMDGFETCRQLRADPATSDIPVLFVTARGETASLLEGFSAGGVDYISKPFQPEEVLTRVRTHLKISRLSRQLQSRNSALSEANERLRAEMNKRKAAESALVDAGEQIKGLSDREAERWGIAAFVGNSRTVKQILGDVRRLQNFSSVNVLITGESGTGKELIARALHFGSNRSKGPFIPVNCVAIPPDLAESMLFGHVRGAFTGATMDRKGYFELAHGGTLFLDEIGDMPAPLQAKLLRVLEDGRITALGASRDRAVDVRVVAATNADLASHIAQGAFRQDMYFRLAQFTVHLPPLRERREDVPLLMQHFLQLFATEMGVPNPPVEKSVIDMLCEYSFPGNVRELKNVIERALIECGGGPILPEHIRLTTNSVRYPRPAPAMADVQSPVGAEVSTNGMPLNLQAAEDLLIRRALAETGGNIAEAARRLGVNRTRIYRKMNVSEK